MFQTIQSKWDTILQRIKEEKELTDVSFTTWLKPLELIRYDNGILTLLFKGPNNSVDFIKKRYGQHLVYDIEDETGIKCELNIVTSVTAAPPKKIPVPQENPAIIAGNINPRYTFDTFVVGNSNKMAHAAALAVAEAPAEIYNPLFIYGGVGLGKTHLMHSIAHFIISKNPSAKVLYVTCETFTNELIDSIRNHSNAEFREKYRGVDVLLIDDIQFLSNKDSTQEEVFHTFNALYEAKKQIIISSDRPPKEIETLADRLRSRFEWGLIVDIKLPDYETRMAILRKKEEMEGYNIDNEVIKYIATNVKSNIRELEGSLTKIVAMSKLVSSPGDTSHITLEMAEEALKDRISPQQVEEITLPYILDIVAEHFNVKSSDILSDRRDKNIVMPRQITMYLCKEMSGMSLQVIGQFLGGRDHSTVIHGCKKVADQLEKDENLKSTIEVLKKKISPV